ncbi:hypothetical protein B484DRAFT_425375 [Ochromonadaceae sp. CCMP2298]|nr:hypothetical protein B484DRAFT_425375 [Ochromonadaceae sp. CCMP2298]
MDDAGALRAKRCNVSLKLMAAMVGAVFFLVLLGEFTSNDMQHGVLDQGHGVLGVVQPSSAVPARSELPVPNVQYIEPVSCAYISAVVGAAAKAKGELWDRWQVDLFPNFLTMMDIPQLSWDLQKAKFVTLLLEASHSRERNRGNRTNTGGNRAVGTKTDTFNLSFVVGFSGSSVTAGHDNYFNESYPDVFRRALEPVFAAMGVPLTVRNHALGNNPCFPYDACVKTHMGEDLDVLAWEQSMNCGRSSKPLDTFSRAAHRMQKKVTIGERVGGGAVV